MPMFVLISFTLGQNPQSKQPEWKSTNRFTHPRTIYIVDNSSEHIPESKDEVWLCEDLRTLQLGKERQLKFVRLIEKVFEAEQDLTFEYVPPPKGAKANQKGKWRTKLALPDEYTIADILCVTTKSKNQPQPGMTRWRCRFTFSMGVDVPGRFATASFALKEPINTRCPPS
jgi:hypothetical protein